MQNLPGEGMKMRPGMVFKSTNHTNLGAAQKKVFFAVLPVCQVLVYLFFVVLPVCQVLVGTYCDWYALAARPRDLCGLWIHQRPGHALV